MSSALRGQLAGFVDYGRFIIMRTSVASVSWRQDHDELTSMARISDFDRGPANEDAYTAFEAEQNGFQVSLSNIFVAGYPIVEAVSRPPFS